MKKEDALPLLDTRNASSSSHQQPQKSKPSLDLLFVKRLIAISKKIAVPYTSLFIPILLLVTLLVQTYVVSLTGSVIGQFYTAIILEDKSQFGHICVNASLVIGASALLESTVKFFVELSAWRWRRRLCAHIQEQYFSNGLFYKIIAFDHRIDNPDQRITTDVDNFTTSLAVVVQNCIATPLIILYYAFHTWTSIAWFAPGLIFAYFLIGYSLTRLVMIPIVGLVFEQEKLEGDFRFSHVRVRSFAEVIALLRGDTRELEDAKYRFNALLQNKMRIVRWHWSLNASSNIFAYMGSILNYAIVALSVFYGIQAPSADYVATASFNCIMLVSGFSGLINISTQLSDLAGYTGRIAHLSEVAAELNDKSLPLSKDNLTYTESKQEGQSDVARVPAGFNGLFHIGDTIKFDRVTCYTPTGKQLVQDISFEVQQGSTLLITGPSGCGKSSLLRILNGLWPSFNGDITKPLELPSQLLYLPQQSYLIRGTIKDQITYPYSQETHPLSDADLYDLLKLVKMEHILELPITSGTTGNDEAAQHSGLPLVTRGNGSSLALVTGRIMVSGYGIDDAMNWADVLSPGEQQRLCLARVFFHRPKFAILDEATSSVSEHMEQHLYENLHALKISFISVGHRSSLFTFHDNILQLIENGGWDICKT